MLELGCVGKASTKMFSMSSMLFKVKSSSNHECGNEGYESQSEGKWIERKMEIYLHVVQV